MDYYNKYIQSFDWKIKREEVLDRYGYRCVKCKTFFGLQIHHLTYKNLGDEKKDELVPLCNDHHKLAHKIKDEKGVGVMEEEIGKAFEEA